MIQLHKIYQCSRNEQEIKKDSHLLEQISCKIRKKSKKDIKFNPVNNPLKNKSKRIELSFSNKSKSKNF